MACPAGWLHEGSTAWTECLLTLFLAGWLDSAFLAGCVCICLLASLADKSDGSCRSTVLLVSLLFPPPNRPI